MPDNFLFFSFGVRASIHTLPKFRPISILFSVDVRYIFGGIPPIKVNFVTILAQLGSILDAKGLPKCNLPPNYHPNVKLWGPFRVPGESLGGYFGACFVKRAFSRYLFVVFFRPLKKERKWSSPRGAGHAIRLRRRMFREIGRAHV